MNVVVNGLMTNYQKVGKGKTVVLLHGWGDTGKTFSKLIENLQDKYSFLILDLPGFGGTQPPENAWGLEDYVDFIHDWLKKIDSGDIYAYGGHSYGGAVEIYGLGAGKLTAQKLFLLASAGIRDKKTFRKRTLKATAKVAKLPLYLLPSYQRKKIKNRLYRTLGSDITLLPHMELTFKRIIGEDILTRAKDIKIPTLLIYGDKDKDTPAADGRILRGAIAGSKLEIIPGAGHFLHQEQAEQVGKLVADFLETKNA